MQTESDAVSMTKIVNNVKRLIKSKIMYKIKESSHLDDFSNFYFKTSSLFLQGGKSCYFEGFPCL